MNPSLRTCADCSTQYALDLPSCPHCGSTTYLEEGGAVVRRLPLFITTSCLECGRGPWTIRLNAVHSGIVEIPTLACASCGSWVPVTWPPEEEPMSPKITTHGGATNARAADVSPAAYASQPPLVGAEADQGRTNSADLETVETAQEPKDEGVVDDEATQNYDGMTLAELKDAATARDLPTYGTKAQLVERLKDADAASE